MNDPKETPETGTPEEKAQETKMPWKNKTSDPIAIPRKNVDKRKDLLEKMKGVKPKA